RIPVSDIHPACAISGCRLEYADLVLDRPVEKPSSLSPPARCNNGHREAVPTRVQRFLRILEVVEAYFDTIHPGDVGRKNILESFPSERDAEIAEKHFRNAWQGARSH